jgi:hypothetical protein
MTKKRKKQKDVMKQWCVMFHNERSQTSLGLSKEHIKDKFGMMNGGIRSVFRMGISHRLNDI